MLINNVLKKNVKLIKYNGKLFKKKYAEEQNQNKVFKLKQVERMTISYFKLAFRLP